MCATVINVLLCEWPSAKSSCVIQWDWLFSCSVECNTSQKCLYFMKNRLCMFSEITVYCYQCSFQSHQNHIGMLCWKYIPVFWQLCWSKLIASIETTLFAIVLFLFHSVPCHGYEDITLTSTRYDLWTDCISDIKFGQCHCFCTVC